MLDQHLNTLQALMPSRLVPGWTTTRKHADRQPGMLQFVMLQLQAACVQSRKPSGRCNLN